MNYINGMIFFKFLELRAFGSCKRSLRLDDSATAALHSCIRVYQVVCQIIRLQRFSCCTTKIYRNFIDIEKTSE